VWKSVNKARYGDINSVRFKCEYLYKKVIKDADKQASVEFSG